jgi:hypothetical protein
MNKRLSSLLMLIPALITIGGCLRLEMKTPPVSNTSTSSKDQVAPSSPTPVESSNSRQERKGQLTIGSITIHGC